MLLITQLEITPGFKAADRCLLFQRVVEKVDNLNRYARLYNIMVPEVYCLVKVRVGSVKGAGKWMCNPFRIPQGSVVISLGVHNEISFESDLQNITNTCCFILGFDDKEQSPKTQQRLSELRGRSIKANISGITEEQKGSHTIDYLMKVENVTRVEILKMDIEGDPLLDCFGLEGPGHGQREKA
ncbi:hypothetical protein Aduo_001409 [Ancylostoma duodenale]